VAVLSVFGFSFVTLVPAWAVQVLQGDATTTGLLQSARGVGALAGALVVAAYGRPGSLARMLAVTSLAFPLALLAFAGVRSQPVAFAVMVAVGAAMMVTLNLCNALLQSLVPDALRGRVMALYSLALFGGMPLGGLLAGTLAERLGEQRTVALGAGVVLLVALVARVTRRRPPTRLETAP
jgi:predicted MFS family arabinose efflux permease